MTERDDVPTGSQQSIRCPACDTVMGGLPEGALSATVRCKRCDSSIGVSALGGEPSIVHDGREDPG